MATGEPLPDSAQQVPEIRQMPYDVTVTPRPGASAGLTEIGRRYWAFVGINELGRVVWSEKSNAINGGGRPYVAAAAGVIAAVAEVSCTGCGLAPWQPRSRTALDELVRDRQQSGCVACDDNLQLAMAQEADPTGEAYRQAANDRRRVQAQTAQERAAAAAAKSRVSSEWEDRQRQVALAAYPLVLTEAPDWESVRSSVAVEAATLACLQYAPTSAPIPPIENWPTPLTPDEEWTRELVRSWWHGGLLKVYPHSDISSFGWKLSLQQVVNESPDTSSWDVVLATMPQPVTTGIYIPRVHWYSPHGPTLETALDRLDEHLTIRLAPAGMSAARQAELLDLLVRIIAEETVRYFDFLIDFHNLPPVPDNHRPRLVVAAQRVAARRPLGETYNLVWQAARTAAAAAQAKPRAPKENMTTHAVNQFEQKAQRAVANLDWELGRWREDTRLPLSALTRVVFLGLLHADPMETSRISAATLLPIPRTDPIEDAATAVDGTEIVEVEAGRDDGETPDSLDATIVAAIRTLTELPEDQDARVALLAFWFSRLDFMSDHEEVTPQSADKEEMRTVHALLCEGIEAMYRAGRSVESATGDARLALVTACAAGAAFPFAVGDDAGNKTTVGRFLAERLLDFASREWKESL